jgi:hypothetical protein
MLGTLGSMQQRERMSGLDDIEHGQRRKRDHREPQQHD